MATELHAFPPPPPPPLPFSGHLRNISLHLLKKQNKKKCFCGCTLTAEKQK